MKILLTIFFILTGCSIYGQFGSRNHNYSRNKSNQPIKTIIKTDILPLMNTLLEEDIIAGSLSAEICYGKCYSLLINCNGEINGKYLDIKKKLEPGVEIRWYIEASPEANLHIGLYSYSEFSSRKIDKLRSENQYIHYRESVFESGISAGCSAALGKRFQVDVTTYMGAFNRYHLKVEEQLNRNPGKREGVLNVRIVLGIGFLI